MRIATIGDWNHWFSYFLEGTLIGSVQNGHWFRPIPISESCKAISDLLFYFKPDIVFCHMIVSGKYQPPEDLLSLMRKVSSLWGTRFILQEGDPRREPRFDISLEGAVSLVLLNSLETEKFSSVYKVPCVHWPYFSLPQERIANPIDDLRCDLSFSGNITPREEGHVHFGRAKFLNLVREKVNLMTFPNDRWGNSRFITPEVSASSFGVLGIHQGWDVKGYLDTRPWQYIGSGGAYFHSKCESIGQFFEEDVHYVAYEHMNLDSLLGKLDDLKRNPGKRAKIREEGFKYCQAYHTPKIRVKQALDILEGKRTEPFLIKEIYGTV